MRSVIHAVFLLGAFSACILNIRPLIAQACQDEEAMVTDLKKDLAGMVETVRKESQADFDRAFHQKACATKLTLCVSMLDEMVGCLEKAAADPAATKEQADAAKAKHDTYAKLKEKLGEYRKSLKATDDSKAAKALIEKFAFPN